MSHLPVLNVASTQWLQIIVSPSVLHVATPRMSDCFHYLGAPARLHSELLPVAFTFTIVHFPSNSMRFRCRQQQQLQKQHQQIFSHRDSTSISALLTAAREYGPLAVLLPCVALLLLRRRLFRGARRVQISIIFHAKKVGRARHSRCSPLAWRRACARAAAHKTKD
eukprot:SAG11_NODE_650_length_7931_cov_9.512385_8_plen_166_part_00